LHANGIFGRAADENLADAFDLAEPLGDDRVAVVIDLGGRQNFGSHG
jgi:hypothetical protein